MTSRARLRENIASETIPKLNRFLIANKEYFLPLLPESNYITKLLKEDGNEEAAVPYVELSEQPKGVRATLKPYQVSGLSFLVHLYNNGMSGMLGDEMGLGKTLQTLSLFQYLEEQDLKSGTASEELRPYLVIAPLSVIGSWVNEAVNWVPDLRVLQFHGTSVERERMKNTPLSAKIVVTSYEVFQSELSWFRHSYVWRYVVLDEGHRIKNHATQVSKSLQSLKAEYRLVLTGTPLQNNLQELWGLLHWLLPQVFTNVTESLFKESFDISRGKVNRVVLDNCRRLLELVMLRRMKDSPGVDLGLPPKEEVLLYVPLTPKQKAWYKCLLTRVDTAIFEDLFTNLSDKEKENESMEDIPSPSGTAWRKLMNLVMQLRKCCSHPYLLPDGAPEPYNLGDHLIKASGKFIVLEKLLKHLAVDQKKKVLIFSGFTQTLDFCNQLLTLISSWGATFRTARLDGSTSRARRNLVIRMFNDPVSDYRVMLLSTRTGGLGITLTAAHNVIFLDEDWNPQITLQAEARAHRIGQTEKVTIYKLCSQDTVEEQMLGRIRKKLYLSAKITESMRNVHGQSQGESEDMPSMETSELKSLLRRGAQTLSHAQIDVAEMQSWDLPTMLEKCRGKAAEDIDFDEEKWLSSMERVECALFEGKHYNRQQENSAEQILPDEVKRSDRRKNKNTTVMVDGFAISKESLRCAEWEAVPTLAGKDDRLKNPKRETRSIHHEESCLVCFNSGGLVSCLACPRSYHPKCLAPAYQEKVRMNRFYCPQHSCSTCGKKASDAGGLLFRCRWCPRAFCEDHLDWVKAILIGENLPEHECLNEPNNPSAYFVKCPPCVDACTEDKTVEHWMTSQEKFYDEQFQEFTGWLEAERTVTSDLGSPPALTDSSLQSPTPVFDGIATPLPAKPLPVTPKKKKAVPQLNLTPTSVKSAKRSTAVDLAKTSNSAKKRRMELGEEIRVAVREHSADVGDDPILAEMENVTIGSPFSASLNLRALNSERRAGVSESDERLRQRVFRHP